MELINLNSLTENEREFYKEVVADQIGYQLNGMDYILNQLSSTDLLVLEEQVDTRYSLSRKLNRNYLNYTRGTTVTSDIISNLVENGISVVYVKRFSFGEQEVLYLRQVKDLYIQNLLSLSDLCSLMDVWLSGFLIETGESINPNNYQSILDNAIIYPNIFYPLSYLGFTPQKLNKYNGIYRELPPPSNNTIPTTPIKYEEGFTQPPKLGLKNLLLSELALLNSSTSSTTSQTPSNWGGGLSNPLNKSHEQGNEDLSGEYASIIALENEIILGLEDNAVKVGEYVVKYPNIPLIQEMGSYRMLFQNKVLTIKKENEQIGSSYKTWFNPNPGIGFQFSYMQVTGNYSKNHRINFINSILSNELAEDIRLQSFFDVIYSNRWFWLNRLINRVYGVYAILYRRMGLKDMFEAEQKDLKDLTNYITLL